MDVLVSLVVTFIAVCIVLFGFMAFAMLMSAGMWYFGIPILAFFVAVIFVAIEYS